MAWRTVGTSERATRSSTCVRRLPSLVTATTARTATARTMMIGTRRAPMPRPYAPAVRRPTLLRVKVFISSDMEGTAGVVDWSQCRPGEPEYGYYRSLLLEEVNAAIEGARAGGATEFLVNDSHSTMQNLRPDQ